MIDLDDIIAIKKLDKGNILGSIQMLPKQCQQAWEESRELNFPSSFQNVDNIVISGMGGSTYGARMVKHLYYRREMLKAPIDLANNYWLPAYVNKKTLVVLSSYSGNTEEVLAVAKQARKKGAKITGITSSQGKLAKFLRFYHYPAYIFNPIHNPSAQPRVGVGYMVMGLVGILSNLEVILIDNLEIENLVSFLQKKTLKLEQSLKTTMNTAKKLALKLRGKIPVIIVTDLFAGAAYALRNQFHETAKQFGLYFSIPELNHHLMEGLSFPSEIKKLLLFVFVSSSIYDKRNSKRLKLTKEVVQKNGIDTETIELLGGSALIQAMELTQFGSWTTFYLGVLNNINPADIPWVNYFKNKLKKISK